MEWSTASIKPANILMTARETYGSERPRSITDFGCRQIDLRGDHQDRPTLLGNAAGSSCFARAVHRAGRSTAAPDPVLSRRHPLLDAGGRRASLPRRDHRGRRLPTRAWSTPEPIPPGRLNPAIPKRLLERVILKCLAKSPDDRFQTGDELAQVDRCAASEHHRHNCCTPICRPCR